MTDPWNDLSREYLEDKYPEAIAVISRLVAELDVMTNEAHRLMGLRLAAEDERDEALRDRSAISEARHRWQARAEAAEAVLAESQERHRSLIRTNDATEAELNDLRGKHDRLMDSYTEMEAEQDDLLHAFQEIWDDWCSGHTGDCNCVVCSLTADALNIDRAALAGSSE